MKTNVIIFLFSSYLQHRYVLAATDAEKLCILEKKMDVLEPDGIKAELVMKDSDRIAALERRMEALELLCIARSGMERHCLVPSVLNGEAHCPGKLSPGAKCQVMCNPGYMATPGKETTFCKKDGFWTIDMECEIPLVIVSGGIVDSSSGDSSVEVLSLYPSNGCDKKIPDMPLADGSHRTMHNLIYLPHRHHHPDRILACNGMTGKQKAIYSYDKDKYIASCDEWSLNTNATNAWKHHTNPNQGSSGEELICEWSTCNHPDRKKGRYASEAVNVAGKTYLLGGMVYDGSGHDPSNSARSLYETDMIGYDYKDYWHNARKSMKRRRAFFCTAKVKEGGVLMIGGLGKNKTGNIVEKSAEFSTLKYSWGIGGLKDISKVTDMNNPRSGHGCTAVPGGNYSVLVTGGTPGFGQTAMANAEMFYWNSNSWRTVASMKQARFGHAVVAVGDRVFAIGGDDRNQNNMDTIEEYDVKKNTWSIIKQKMKKPRSNFGFTLVPHSVVDGCVIEKPLTE